MLFNWNLLSQDIVTYKIWLTSKTEAFDRILFIILYGGLGSLFILGTVKANAAVLDLMLGSAFSLLWTFIFIPIPWIAEGKNVARYRNANKNEIKIILHTRLLEQFIILTCFQLFFMALAIIGDFFHPNTIIGYNFNYLTLRICYYFLLMIGMDWFFLVFAIYIGFHYMNYLKFSYYDLIQKKNGNYTTIRDYNKVVSILRRPYHFNVKPLGFSMVLLTFFTIMYCLPATFYVLFLGNFPPLTSLPDARGDLLVMQFTPYIIFILNLLFISVGFFLWFKIPHVIQTIPETLYSLPPEYVAILQNLH